MLWLQITLLFFITSMPDSGWNSVSQNAPVPSVTRTHHIQCPVHSHLIADYTQLDSVVTTHCIRALPTQGICKAFFQLSSTSLFLFTFISSGFDPRLFGVFFFHSCLALRHPVCTSPDLRSQCLSLDADLCYCDLGLFAPARTLIKSIHCNCLHLCCLRFLFFPACYLFWKIHILSFLLQFFCFFQPAVFMFSLLYSRMKFRENIVNTLHFPDKVHCKQRTVKCWAVSERRWIAVMYCMLI